MVCHILHNIRWYLWSISQAWRGWWLNCFTFVVFLSVLTLDFMGNDFVLMGNDLGLTEK